MGKAGVEFQYAASEEAKDRIMDSGGFNWAILNIIGPLLILIVLAWAVLKNRKSSKSEIDRTEAATRELYREEDAAHRKDDTFGT